MATISSLGVGSGLDLNSIVTKMVDLEKAPLTQLQAQASLITTKISAYGQLKSMATTLSDAALNLSLSSTWKATSVSSSSVSSVAASTSGGATPATGSYSVEVQQLARAQSTSSARFSAGSAIGTGTLQIQLGTWSGGAFTAGSASAVNVDISASANTLTEIASQINAANAGVTASVLTDSSGQRLLVRSSATGEAQGFKITTTSTDGLAGLAFDPQNSPGAGMAANSVQYGQNAQATINGAAIDSASNTLTDTISGLSLQLAQVTTAPVEVIVKSDTTAMQKAVQTFVDAYNAMSKAISDATKYDSTGQATGLLQGDSTAVGLQNALRLAIGSTTAGSVFSRLSDLGVTIQQDGALSINSTKLGTAFQNMTEVQKFFTIDNGNAQTNGFGLKIKSLLSGMLSTTGSIATRTAALQTDQKKNTADQDKVNERASQVETRLQKQYAALDTKVAQLNALNTYITQQITQWNKSTK